MEVHKQQKRQRMLSHYDEILKGRKKRKAREAAKAGNSCSTGAGDGNQIVLYDENGTLFIIKPSSPFYFHSWTCMFVSRGEVIEKAPKEATTPKTPKSCLDGGINVELFGGGLLWWGCRS